MLFPEDKDTAREAFMHALFVALQDGHVPGGNRGDVRVGDDNCPAPGF